MRRRPPPSAAARRTISFDRIAERYDETRGGLERGRGLAEAIGAFVVGADRILEVGVGTGAVAAAFAEAGRRIVGVDISAEMLGRAATRIGHRVARADAHALPVASSSIGATYIVWVLHLVADPGAVLAECARVLRRTGRLVTTAGRPTNEAGDMTDLQDRLAPLRAARLNNDGPEHVREWAEAAGLRLLEQANRVGTFEHSPAEAARGLETRSFSFTWDLDDETWATHVQPVIEWLRALPDPDRPRHTRQTERLLVFEKP